MSLYKPSKLRQFLQDLRSKPKKSLSQNFLIDSHIVEKLTLGASISPEDIVLEIGPGPGVITEALLKKKATVLAIELDHDFAKALSGLEETNLKILSHDFLKIDLEELLTPYVKAGKKIKVVSNIPFQITTPILEKLYESAFLFESFTLIVQKEAAKRFLSKPTSKLYGYLNVLINLYGSARLIHSISPRSFYPKPHVYCAILKCELKDIDLPLDSKAVCLFIKNCFKYKRKLLLNSLKEQFSDQQILSAYKNLSLNAKTRPSDLSAEMYLKLYRFFMKSASEGTS